MSDKEKLITKYDANTVLDSAYSMTGNRQFLEIKKRMEQQEKMILLLAGIHWPFPDKGNPYQYGSTLEKLISERVKDTKELLERCNLWKKGLVYNDQ